MQNDTKKMNKRTKQALWWMIGPTALLVGAFFLSVFMNLLLSATGGNDAIRTIVNVIVFISGAVSTLTWLPGIIIGIVLLSTQKK